MNKIKFYVYGALFSMITFSSGQAFYSLNQDSESEQLARTHTILSIDGGGVRGIIPAIILEYLENKLEHSLSDYFDVMAGTSTGSLITLGLNIPNSSYMNLDMPEYSAHAIVEKYEELGPVIFNEETARPWSSLGGLIKPYYSSVGLERAAQIFYKETLLSKTLTNVVIPGLDIETNRPIYFSSHQARRSDAQNFFLKDVAVAASSAPTYFSPKRLKSLAGNTHSVIDAALIATNPGLIAYAHAEELYNSEIHDKFLLSLGTGQISSSFSHSNMQEKGAFGWIQEIIPLMLQNESKLSDDMLSKFLPDKTSKHKHSSPQRYYRIQTQINKQLGRIDDASPDNFAALKKVGQQVIKEFDNSLNNTVDQLELI